jgi:DNA-binding winged helix-turn-helix (wHTH) protein
MAKQINHFYEFGSIRLDATNRLLYKDSQQLPLQPRVVETLLVLVKNAHAVVGKERILDEVWPDVDIEEGGLRRNVSLLRKALGEEGRF